MMIAEAIGEDYQIEKVKQSWYFLVRSSAHKSSCEERKMAREMRMDLSGDLERSIVLDDESIVEASLVIGETICNCFVHPSLGDLVIVRVIKSSRRWKLSLTNVHHSFQIVNGWGMNIVRELCQDLSQRNEGNIVFRFQSRLCRGKWHCYFIVFKLGASEL